MKPSSPPTRRLLPLACLGSAALFACSDPADPAPPDDVRPSPAEFIDTDFEGASLASAVLAGPDSVELTLAEDTNSHERFWFSFRIVGKAGRRLTLRVLDVAELAPAATWAVTQPVMQHGNDSTWTRVTTRRLVGNDFEFSVDPQGAETRIALKIPYNFSRWLALLDDVRSDPQVSVVEEIGRSRQGRPLHLLHVSDPHTAGTNKPAVVAIGRQHPGEPGGSYMLGGFLAWLLSGSDDAAALLRAADVLLVPFMNPDGVVLGNQRTNEAGLDLNRQWERPDPVLAPTVAAVTNRLLEEREAGREFSMVLDFHAAPPERSNFFFYSSADATSAASHEQVVRVIERASRENPDFVGVDGSIEVGDVGATWAHTWAVERLGAPGLAVESSGNDVTYGPNEGKQQTVDRLEALGAAIGRAVAIELFGIGGSGGGHR